MALPALATIAQLETRLGVPVGSLAGVELAQAQALLEDASELVRAETGKSWVDEDNLPIAPGPVQTIVCQIVIRYLKNPDGYTSESEDGYTWRREGTDVDGGLYLTDQERRLLSRYSTSNGGLYTIPTTKRPYSRDVEIVLIDDQFGGDPIGMYDPYDIGQEV